MTSSRVGRVGGLQNLFIRPIFCTMLKAMTVLTHVWYYDIISVSVVVAIMAG